MEKVWLKHYEPGVPSDIEPKEKSLTELFENSFQQFASNNAFSCMGRTLTFAELDQASAAAAAFFQKKLGLTKGDRIALMMPNILQYPVALFGALRAGLTIVNVNPLYTERELAHQLEDSGAKAIVILANFAITLEKVLQKSPVQHIVLTELGDMMKFPKNLLVNFVVKRVKKMVPEFNLPGAIAFNNMIIEGRQLQLDKPELNLDDLAFLQYTGGTTGVAKGAMLTHGNMVSNINQAYAWINNHLIPNEEIIITALPLYHIFSLTANCLTYMRAGAHNILIPNPRDIPGFVKELKKWNYTAFTGLNTLFNALLNNEDFCQSDFSSLRLVLGGGMAVQRAVADRWLKVTGVPIIQAYGLTETSPAACINPMNLEGFNGTIGLPISSTLVEIRDDDGNPLGLNEPGEICIKGPQVMKGYWNRPDETAKVLDDNGWLRTGDVGTMSEDGFVTIVDRKKDMILVSGFNVYPNEVEEVAVTHESIVEAAAVAVPDERSGEAVKLFVVSNNPSLTGEDVIAHCRTGLTNYKVPKFVEFKEELPKTNVGKILRRALR